MDQILSKVRPKYVKFEEEFNSKNYHFDLQLVIRKKPVQRVIPSRNTNYGNAFANGNSRVGIVGLINLNLLQSFNFMI